MQITSAEFLTSAADVANCPPHAAPEFAFIGRSNVGKSSLINLLTGKTSLARASGTPGKTTLMNFYLVNGRWCLVDLPGYGFAKVARSQRADFNRASAEYLETRGNLKCAFVLLDGRHAPQAIDMEFLSWIADSSAPFALIFTKMDKLSKTQARENVESYKKHLSASWPELPEIFCASAVTKEGRGEILRFIDGLAREG